MKGCHTNNRTSGYTTTQKVNKNLRYSFKNFILWLKQLTYVGVWPECLISTIKEARKLNTKTKTLFTVSSTPQLVSNTGKNFLLRLMIWQPDGTAICANVKQLLSLCCKEIKNIKRDGWDEVGTDFGKKMITFFRRVRISEKVFIDSPTARRRIAITSVYTCVLLITLGSPMWWIGRSIGDEQYP